MSQLQFAPAETLDFTPVVVAPSQPAKWLRTLHIVNGEHYSGAERVQDHLALQLPLLGVGLDFATLKRGKFASMRQSDGTTLHEFPMRSRVDFRVVRGLTQLVRSEGYDLVHAHTPRSALVAAQVARRTGLPWVYHVHSPVTRDSERWLQNWINAVVEARALRSASRVVVVSPSLMAYMHDRGVDPARVACVPNGVPTSTRPRTPGVPRGEWTIGMVALFRPRKGVEVLLEAMSELVGRGLPVRLRGVGAFETEAYERSIREMVARLGLEAHIDWTGFTRDVASELTRCDLMALPSLFGEGLPMVLLEGMAAGLPAVVSDVEGASTAVVDGETGLVVPPSDPVRLAEAIEGIVRGQFDYTAMASAAQARHAEYFSDAAMARGVAGVYEALCPTRVG
jgi:glycosyltransferase involved in cell wall biosynthesis